METQLSASASSNSPIVHYIWSPIAIDSADVFDYTNCPDSSNCSTPYVKPPFTTIFMVTAVNADSCTASDTVTVYVHNDAGLAFIPTAFTPNGDGLNDRFTFAILGANTIAVSIFDRWGEMLYHTTNFQEGWNGYFKGVICPNDVYVYKITFDDDVENADHKYIGKVTIVR